MTFILDADTVGLRAASSEEVEIPENTLTTLGRADDLYKTAEMAGVELGPRFRYMRSVTQM